MLTQKLILSYGSKLVVQFIHIVASIVVARIAGPSILGTVAFGTAFVSIFSFVSTFLGPAHVKLVSEGKNLGKCVSTYAILKFLSTALFLVMVIALFFIQKDVLNIRFESKVHEYVIFIILVSVVIEQLLAIPRSTFQGRTEQAKQDIPDIIRLLIYQVLRISVVLVGLRAIALALANLVSMIIVTPIYLHLFRGYPRGPFDRPMAMRYLKISIPIFFMDTCTNAISYLDKIILQFFTNSRYVGYYTAGYSIGGFLLLMTSSVGILFFPLFSEAAARRDHAFIKDKIEKFERFCFIFIMPPVIFFALYSDVIVKVIFGNQYIPSINALSIITIAAFIMVLSNPYGNVITGMGHFSLALRAYLVSLLSFISLSIIFVHPKILNLGVDGMACAILASNIFIGVLFRLFAKAKCNVIDITKNIKFVVGGIINFVLFFILYAYGKKTYGMNFQLFFPLLYFTITYFAFIYLRWIDKEDWARLIALAKINKVFDYIKHEIRPKNTYKD
jgi:O-antigen/teichoic acid export membrane protein